MNDSRRSYGPTAVLLSEHTSNSRHTIAGSMRPARLKTAQVHPLYDAAWQDNEGTALHTGYR